MSAWVLIVAFVVPQPVISGTAMLAKSHAVAMETFLTLKACQNAGAEAQKIAPGTKFVCVPQNQP
jgi:hypothetical protein